VRDHASPRGLLIAAPPLWQFAHELVRESLVRRVPLDRQVAIHRDAAARLEQSGAAPAILARHWLAADRPERAVPHLLAAAERAAAERTIRAVWRRGGWVAALAEASAHVARAEGDRAEAARLWQEAELEYARSGQPLDAGRCARARASLGGPPDAERASASVE
jgi:hypothetical protein